MSKNSEKISIDAVKKFAQSPEGQRLYKLIQSQDQEAVRQAQAGNYDEAMVRLKSFLNTPEAQKLLKDLGGSK